MPTSWLRRYVARNRRGPLVGRVARVCQSYLAAYHNADYDFASNGELFVLRTLSRFPIETVFDVGANVGEWTRAAAAAFPEAAIYSFEISSRTFEQLAQRTRDLVNVRRVQSGLSDQEGSVKLHYYADLPVLTTVLDFPHQYPSTEIIEPVTTGAAYCAEQGVGRIDLLKIDVEGMDPQVLAGFDGMLRDGKIDVVQFEYGQGNIVSKFLLRDFWQFFDERGYAMGKIYPSYVDFREYRMDDEDFIGPNYLACRREKTAYLEALGSR